MKSLRPLPVGLAVGVAGLALLLAWLLRGEPSVPVGSSPGQQAVERRGAPVDGSTQPPPSRSRPEVLESSAPATIKIRVVDALDSWLPGARVAACNDLPRVQDGSERDLGDPGDDGWVTWTRVDDKAPPRYLAARAPGFLPQVVDGPQWGEQVTLRLERGVQMHARAVDPAGNGVEGVMLVLSQSPLPGFVFDPARNAGVVITENVHCAVSDSNGMLEVDGLAPGKYDYRVLHPAYAWVPEGDEFRIPGLEIPRSAATFVVRRFRACYKHLTGPTIVAQEGWYADGVGGWHWEQVSRWLRQRSKADRRDIVWALSVEGFAPEELRLRVFLSRIGWRQFEWPFTDYTTDSVPEVVALAADAEDPSVSGMVKVTVRDEQGMALDVHGLRLEHKGAISFSVDLEHGVESEAPLGSYKLGGGGVYLSRTLAAQTVEVRAGNPLVLDLVADVVPYRWDLKGPDGRELVGGALAKLRCVGWPEQYLMVRTGETMLLPRGALEFELMTQLLRSPPTRVEITPDAADKVLTCVLQP